MENALNDEFGPGAIETPPASRDECEVVPIRPERYARESLSENFIEELEGWARRALAANGFGDC